MTSLLSNDYFDNYDYTNDLDCRLHENMEQFITLEENLFKPSTCKRCKCKEILSYNTLVWSVYGKPHQVIINKCSKCKLRIMKVMDGFINIRIPKNISN